ncbi:MAG: PLP-dependent aminotransferase family protein [archaeon]
MNDISFGTGSLGRNALLEEVLRKSLQGICPEEILDYGDPLGLPVLRAYVANVHGTTLDHVLIASSAQQALNMIMQAEMPRKLLIQEPAFFGLLRIAKKTYGTTVPSTMDHLVEKLMVQPDLVYINSNFYAPSGVSVPQKIKDALAKSGALIVEDNPQDQLYYEQKPTTIFDKNKHGYYVSGFSKTLSPGLRIAYILSSPERISRLKSTKITEDIFTSTLAQNVCLNALHQDYLGALRHAFREKRDLAMQLFHTAFPENAFHIVLPEGGIFLALQHTRMKDIIAAAKDYGLLLEDDRFTYLDGKSRNVTRINFVQNSDAVLEEGVRRLKQAYEHVLRK